MNYKVSIEKAEKEAKELSIEYADVRYYVIGHKRKAAKVYSVSAFAIKEINKNNYFPVCSYFNGRRFI